jgi:hypothetical protein
MRRLGRVPEKPASLAVFNHAILYVPRLDLWLDGTAAYSGTRELPAEDRGATVLVVNPGEPARFGYVPEARPEDDRTVTSMEISVAPDGSAAARGESWVSGERAPSYRRSYQAENERRAAFEHAMSRAFPGLKVEEVAVSDLSRIEEDVALRFRLSLARFAQREGDGLRFSPFGESQTYSQSYAPLSARRHDLLLGGPFENRFTYRFLLPAGWAPRELPDPASLDVPFGALEVRFRAEGGSLVAEGRIALKAGRVSAADYPAFRDFVSRVDRALSPTVRVGPPPAASASP